MQKESSDTSCVASVLKSVTNTSCCVVSVGEVVPAAGSCADGC